MSDNTLKRTMKLHHLVIFGVAFLTPMIAYTIYGVIATASHGVESGSICFAVIAMLFTALSYGHMAKAFPAAGSTYTYTRKAINAKLGVVAGWIVLLGYVFFPMAIWLIGASYFSAAVPAVSDKHRFAPPACLLQPSMPMERPPPKGSNATGRSDVHGLSIRLQTP